MSQGWGALRLLVVDDNRHMLAIVHSLAQALGMREIRQAADGGEGLRLLRQAPSDIALVDLNMAPMDGVAFTREVRTSPDSVDVYMPVVMMTGHVERHRVEQARDAGVHEFILKPLTLTSLVGRLEAVIHRPRPFVRAPTYFGPDRRRRADPLYRGALRRAEDRGEAARPSVVEI